MSGHADEAVSAGEARFRELIVMLEQNARTRVAAEPVERRFPDLADVAMRDVVIPGPHGPIPGRTYRGPSGGDVGLVWVHGGAFVAGDLDMYEAHWVSLELAARGIAVLSIDHRKALDGVHHPVPSDEVLAGWLAAAEDADLLGLPLERLHLGGASAGANLSAGVALRLRDGGGPAPASLVLVYPVFHAVLPQAAPDAAAAAAGLPDEFRFDPAFMRAVSLNYVGDADLLKDPVAFPANGRLGGLPPAYILNAEADDLRSSGEAFAAQLHEAGVPVQVEFEPETVHGYLDSPGVPAAVTSLDRIAGWMRSTGR